MTKDDLIRRNKKFAIDVLQMTKTLPNDRLYDGLIRQLVRCATSVGANYRAVCRAKSTADFINKLKITEEESDESNYFLDLISSIDKDPARQERFQKLIIESNELTAIYSAAIITMRQKIASKPKS